MERSPHEMETGTSHRHASQWHWTNAGRCRGGAVHARMRCVACGGARTVCAVAIMPVFAAAREVASWRRVARAGDVESRQSLVPGSTGAPTPGWAPYSALCGAASGSPTSMSNAEPWRILTITCSPGYVSPSDLELQASVAAFAAWFDCPQERGTTTRRRPGRKAVPLLSDCASRGPSSGTTVPAQCDRAHAAMAARGGLHHVSAP